jgi:DNA-binding transcriptional regulator LsrR (DeoR family)
MTNRQEATLLKIEITKLKCRGYTAAQIAQKLGISERKVWRYFAKIREDSKKTYLPAIAEIKLDKLSELAELKKLVYEAIDDCRNQGDNGTVSRLVSNVLKAVDTEISILGVKAPPQQEQESEIDVETFMSYLEFKAQQKKARGEDCQPR